MTTILAAILNLKSQDDDCHTELSTGRKDPRVGSGLVGSGHDFAEFLRVGSGQPLGFFNFSLIIAFFLNRYESANTTFGLKFDLIIN